MAPREAPKANRSELVTLGLFLVIQVFGFGGFIFTTREQLTNITTEFQKLNDTVAKISIDSVRIEGKINNIDYRLNILEQRK